MIHPFEVGILMKTLILQKTKMKKESGKRLRFLLLIILYTFKNVRFANAIWTIIVIFSQYACVFKHQIQIHTAHGCYGNMPSEIFTLSFFKRWEEMSMEIITHQEKVLFSNYYLHSLEIHKSVAAISYSETSKKEAKNSC